MLATKTLLALAATASLALAAPAPCPNPVAAVGCSPTGPVPLPVAPGTAPKEPPPPPLILGGKHVSQNDDGTINWNPRHIPKGKRVGDGDGSLLDPNSVYGVENMPAPRIEGPDPADPAAQIVDWTDHPVPAQAGGA